VYVLRLIFKPLASALHKTIPTYAAYPNFAWQAVKHSHLIGIEQIQRKLSE